MKKFHLRAILFLFVLFFSIDLKAQTAPDFNFHIFKSQLAVEQDLLSRKDSLSQWRVMGQLYIINPDTAKANFLLKYSVGSTNDSITITKMSDIIHDTLHFAGVQFKSIERFANGDTYLYVLQFYFNKAFYAKDLFTGQEMSIESPFNINIDFKRKNQPTQHKVFAF